MTDATDQDMKEAKRIVNRGGFDSPDDLVNAIASALAAARVSAGGVRADPTKVRWVDPIGSCWVQIPDDWKDYHNHGDVRVTLRPSGEKIDDVVAVACPSPPREVPPTCDHDGTPKGMQCPRCGRLALASATIAAGNGEGRG